MTTISAQWNGEGTLQELDEASSVDDPQGHVASGGVFQTTKTRLKTLTDQGFDVVEVNADPAAATSKSDAAASIAVKTAPAKPATAQEKS